MDKQGESCTKGKGRPLSARMLSRPSGPTTSQQTVSQNSTSAGAIEKKRNSLFKKKRNSLSGLIPILATTRRSFSTGDRVQHEEYGNGQVDQVVENVGVWVDFESVGNLTLFKSKKFVSRHKKVRFGTAFTKQGVKDTRHDSAERSFSKTGHKKAVLYHRNSSPKNLKIDPWREEGEDWQKGDLVTCLYPNKDKHTTGQGSRSEEVIGQIVPLGTFYSCSDKNCKAAPTEVTHACATMAESMCVEVVRPDGRRETLQVFTADVRRFESDLSEMSDGTTSPSLEGKYTTTDGRLVISKPCHGRYSVHFENSEDDLIKFEFRVNGNTGQWWCRGATLDLAWSSTERLIWIKKQKTGRKRGKDIYNLTRSVWKRVQNDDAQIVEHEIPKSTLRTREGEARVEANERSEMNAVNDVVNRNLSLEAVKRDSLLEVVPQDSYHSAPPLQKESASEQLCWFPYFSCGIFFDLYGSR